MADCLQCDDTGWRKVTVEGVEGVERCDHRGPELEFEEAALVTEVDWNFYGRLSREEKAVHHLIFARRGRANAIRLKEIVDAVWPQSIALRSYQEQENCQRAVKGVVQRMREEARYPVVATKTRPAGYFLAETMEERREYRNRLMQEAWKLIGLAQLFVRDPNLGETLKRGAEEL